MRTFTTPELLHTTRTRWAAGTALAIGLAGPAAAQVTIDNDKPTTEQGYYTVEVESGGESRNATLRGRDLSDNSLTTTDVLFDYFSYVDVGNGAFRLDNATAGPTLDGDDRVVSSGSFTGSGGNTINWTVTSSIANGQSLYTNRIEFDAMTGTIGNLTFYQYLDEDVFNVSDDVFFTRGSAATNDLELFTLDGATGIGVSQGGAFTAAQGLSNASFIGYAADSYNDIKPRLTAGTQNVSPNGVIDAAALPQTNNELLDSTVRGPNDVVSVMAWQADAGATNAVVLTTLGGVADGSAVPLPEPGQFVINALPGDVITQSLYVEDENGTPLAITLLNQASFVGPDGALYRPGYSTIDRVITWDTTGREEGTYILDFNIRNASGQFDNGSVTVNLVPEPASLALLGLGGLMMSGRRRR